MKQNSSLNPMIGYAMALQAVIGLYQSYSSVYFAAQGLDHAQVGLLQAAAPLTAIFAQPLWGYAADRSADRRRVLRILLFAAAAAVCTWPLAKTLPWMLAAVAAFALFQTSLQPLSDTLMLEEVNRQGLPFGPLRIAGTVSFAAVTWIAGRVFENHGTWMPWSVAAALLLTLAASSHLPRQKAKPAGGLKLSSLIKDRALMGHLFFVCGLQITLGFFFSFFPVYFTGEAGGSRTLLGWAYLIGSASEIPFLVFGDKLFERLGVGRLLVISAVCMLLRWIVLTLFSSLPVIMVSQILQGGGFVIMMFAMAKYIALHVPQNLRASGQSLLGMAGYGVARVIGIMLGGWLSGSWGIRPLFGGSAGLIIVLLLMSGRKLWRENG